MAFSTPHIRNYAVLGERLRRLQEAGSECQPYDGLIGLEKESLRVAPEGGISQLTHPQTLGSPLTNPYITTDYSEALLELITPPFAERIQPLQFLCDLHKFVYDRLEDDEIIWATSMPCVLEGGKNIPLARYGHSNAGQMKTVYRRGLGHRYGRVMQVISGVHFNYSVPQRFWSIYQELEQSRLAPQQFIADQYFCLLRNLIRIGWLVPYLFGASPAVCKSFLGGRATNLHDFNETTYYAPYATSLRMGDIGYQNSKEQGTGVKVSYDSLQDYAATLKTAIETPCSIYQTIGVKVNGRYEQLNANILQIENEYYSTVRPKQIPEYMEKPVLALQRRGVRYLELRSLDVNAYNPLGIDQTQIHFLETLMLFCLLHVSPTINVHEQREIDRNGGAAAHRGRDPNLYLQRNGEELKLKDWGIELCDAMQPIAEMLDAMRSTQDYTKALQEQRTKLLDPESTPSARMLREMRERGEGFYAFAKRKSMEHAEYFQRQTLAPEAEKRLHDEAEASWRKQHEIEAADSKSFDQFLDDYFAQS